MIAGVIADSDARSSTQKHAAALVGLADQSQCAVCGLVTAMSSQRMPRPVRAPAAFMALQTAAAAREGKRCQDGVRRDF